MIALVWVRKELWSLYLYIDTSIKELENLLEPIQRERNNFLYGIFQLKYFSLQSKHTHNRLSHIFSLYGFFKLIKHLTRITKKCKSLIDNIYTTVSMIDLYITKSNSTDENITIYKTN